MYEQSKRIEQLKKDTVNKFVSVSVLNEQNQETEVEKKATATAAEPVVIEEEEEELNDMQRAAKLKNFGKLTRVEYEWRPNPVVCKRFNVPNPYPE